MGRAELGQQLLQRLARRSEGPRFLAERGVFGTVVVDLHARGPTTGTQLVYNNPRARRRFARVESCEAQRLRRERLGEKVLDAERPPRFAIFVGGNEDDQKDARQRTVDLPYVIAGRPGVDHR